MNNVPNEGKVDFSKPILWIVIPCYNEKDVLPITAPMFLEQIQTMISKEKISANSRILFVMMDRRTQHGILSVSWHRRMNIILELARAETEVIRMLYLQG